jgi:hypothetical protein
MKEYYKFVCLLSISVLLYAPSIVAQDDENTQPSKKNPDKSATESTDGTASQEVGINEDIYRQFMELKDARQLRNMIPEEAFKPGSGLQKLDKLPEESQKHLRNQLREIIVQGDQWQPGDEGKHYPYVPSEAASTDPGLQKQEAEAWGELVDGYHRREADIYKNSARTQAAMAAEGASQGGSNTGNGSPGDGTGQSGAGEQASQESQPEQNTSAGSSSSNAPRDPNARSGEGVSQNAMEFLQGLANQGQGEGEGEGSVDTLSPGDGQGEAKEESNVLAEQSSTPQSTNTEAQPANTSNNPEAKSMVGTSQNALEFIQGNGDQGEDEADGSADTPMADTGQGDEGEAKTGQEISDEQDPVSNTPPALTSSGAANEQDGQSTTGASQNALNYLTGDATQPGSGEAESPGSAGSAGQQGTLSIGDLRNAQGVGNTNAAGELLIKKPDEQGSGQTPSEKDGDG